MFELKMGSIVNFTLPAIISRNCMSNGRTSLSYETKTNNKKDFGI